MEKFEALTFQESDGLSHGVLRALGEKYPSYNKPFRQLTSEQQKHVMEATERLSRQPIFANRSKKDYEVGGGGLYKQLVDAIRKDDIIRIHIAGPEEQPTISIETLEKNITACREFCYAQVGIKGTKGPGEDPNSTGSQNFLKGVIDEAIEPIAALISIGKMSISEFWETIKKIDVRKLAKEVLRAFTNGWSSPYDLGTKSWQLVSVLFGGIIATGAKILKETGRIRNNEKLVNVSRNVEHVATLGRSWIKEKFKGAMWSSTNPRIQYLVTKIDQLDNWIRTKTNKNGTEYLAIFAAGGLGAYGTYGKIDILIDQAEASLLVDDVKQAEEKLQQVFALQNELLGKIDG